MKKNWMVVFCVVLALALVLAIPRPELTNATAKASHSTHFTGNTIKVYNNDATCTTDGTYTEFCNYDNDCKVSRIIDAPGSAKGHLFSDYVSDNNATCTEDGTESSTCQREGCQAKVIQVIKGSALGHDVQRDEARDVPAACGVPGVIGYSCTRCDVTDDQPSDPLEHNEVTVPGYPPSCTEPGLTDGSKCDGCDLPMKEQETIPPTGHTPITVDPVLPTYTTSGSTGGEKCGVCGTILSGCEGTGTLTPKLAGLALMRVAPDQNSDMIWPLLKPSTSFTIIGEMQNWFYPIMLANGTTGYIHWSYIVTA